MSVIRNIVRLEDVTTRIGDGLHGTPKYDESGEYYFINGNNLSGGKIEVKTDTKRITAEEYNKIKRELNNRTILLAINGTIGNLGFYNGERVALGKSACYLNLKENVDKHYIRYVLEHSDFQEYALAFATGATIKNLGLKAVRDYKFLLPPLPTQHRIASILSAYDDLIENNLKRIKLLEELAQRTYEEWFVKFRINGVQLPIDEKTGLPEGWKMVSMTKIADFINGFAFKPTDWMNHGLPIIKIKEMKSGIGVDTPHYDGNRVPKKYLIKSGDILFSWSGSLEVIIWQGIDGWLNQHLFLVKPLNDVPREFVHQSLLKTLQEFNNLTTGSTMKHIKRKELDFVKIALPSDKILISFKKAISPVQNQILMLARENQYLKQSRDILLPRLMSGKINVE